MEIADIDFTRFHGGQMECRNCFCLYRGEIKTIVPDGNNILIQLAWHAKGEHRSGRPSRWVKYEIPAWRFLPKDYHINSGEYGRIEFFNPGTAGTRITLYLPGDDPLLRSQVEGLS